MGPNRPVRCIDFDNSFVNGKHGQHPSCSMLNRCCKQVSCQSHGLQGKQGGAAACSRFSLSLSFSSSSPSSPSPNCSSNQRNQNSSMRADPNAGLPPTRLLSIVPVFRTSLRESYTVPRVTTLRSTAQQSTTRFHHQHPLKHKNS